MLGLGLDLPLAHSVPPSLWHAHEMLIGAFGAALIGFLTTRRAGMDRYRAAARPTALDPRWPSGGSGARVGLFGWDGMGAIGALADLAWMAGAGRFPAAPVVATAHRPAAGFRLLARPVDGLQTAAARWGFLTGDIALAGRALEWVGLVFLGLLGLGRWRESPCQ